MNSQAKSNPSTIILYFQVHQPWRLRSSFSNTPGEEHDYFDTEKNKEIMLQVASRCYLPANAGILKCIQKNPEIKVTFSISGTALDQMNEFCPEALESFRMLAATGSVEFLAETDYHSLAGTVATEEFLDQVAAHSAKLNHYLGVKPNVFRNTALIYNNEIGRRISTLGFKAVFIDGVDRILQGRTPNALYHHPEKDDLKLFVRNYQLSDQISFGFLNGGDTLRADDFIAKLDQQTHDRNADSLVMIGLDYETFGEHLNSETGIIAFLEQLLTGLSADPRFSLSLPSDVLKDTLSVDTINVPQTISWSDRERDISGWLDNDMQVNAFTLLMELESIVRRINDPLLTTVWKRLMTNDHFHYMSTRSRPSFSPYRSPEEAFATYMTVLNKFRQEINDREAELAQVNSEASKRDTQPPVWAMKLENGYEK